MRVFLVMKYLDVGLEWIVASARDSIIIGRSDIGISL